MILRGGRAARIAVTLVLAGATAIGIFAVRAPILRGVGSMLVVSEPLSPVDVVVVSVDGGAAAVLEAADLVHARMTTRVAVFADPPDEVDREFLRRGIPYEDRAAQSQRLLALLGVENVERIGRPATGTESEGRILPDWCDSRHLRSVAVVTTPDHSRRMARVLRRAMKGRATRVIVRPTRYSSFVPDRWWQTRGGLRTGIVELQKLVLDFVRHPLS
jgi:hypothetical protein